MISIVWLTENRRTLEHHRSHRAALRVEQQRQVLALHVSDLRIRLRWLFGRTSVIAEDLRKTVGACTGDQHHDLNPSHHRS